MKPYPILSRNSLLRAAETACQAHPCDALAAHRVFLQVLATHGVRTHRLPDLVLHTIQGALDRSLGDPKRAAWRIQADLMPMSDWWRIGPDHRAGRARPSKIMGADVCARTAR